MDIPPMIASSMRSKDEADFCFVVVLVREKSKIGEKVAWSCVWRSLFCKCAVRIVRDVGEVKA